MALSHMALSHIRGLLASRGFLSQHLAGHHTSPTRPRSTKKRRPGLPTRRRELKSRSALTLEILRRCLALVGDFLVLDDLPLVQTAEAGLLDRRDMDKHIFSARLGLDKSVPLLRIEPLYGAARH